MPDRLDPFEAALREEAELRELAAGYADLGMGWLADSLGEPRPVPRLTDAPLVVDTDLGGDPDDALALVIAARHVPELALVLTTDEHQGRRARFARQLLAACGRPEVPVVAGPPLSGHSRFCVTDLLDPHIPAQPTDPAAAVADLAAAVDGPLRWAGLGPMTNLAELLRTRPQLAGRIHLTQMGGAVSYRDRHRGEHNIRRDVPAAGYALATVGRATLVTSDVTFTPELELTTDSPLYRRWSTPRAPQWAGLLAAHLQRWTTVTGHPGSMAHDPLTLAVALRLPFVDVDRGRVSFTDTGVMTLGWQGSEVFYTHTAHYPAIRRWLDRQLDPDPPADGTGHPPSPGGPA